MPPLQRELRKNLEAVVVKARSAAEDSARAALSTLAVDRDKAFDQMSESQRDLRRALRAKGRQLGTPEALIAEIAYQHWHRMLFARFLAENGLLIHPEAGIAVSLEEVAELARDEGASNLWAVSARYAAQMLPAIFRADDPELALQFAPEGRKRLEELLALLPASVFTSDDALGWVYQFWQSEKKKQVNKAGERIGASELPAVTQLFTEGYMVRFLLENSLGAWWAAGHPDSPLLERFTYLRRTDEGTPAAGMFEGWPERVAEITVMDPCSGSGHFLTVAFEMLTAMRVEEEGLSAREAGDAVIAENLFGLELDPRCTQIAAFGLALSAWRSGGYRELPPPNIACSGIGVAGQLSEWKKLAGGDEELENALTAVHEQFRSAPELGSLIDPRRATEEGHLFSVDYDRVAPLIEELLSREEDPETQVAGWAAAGIARAASLLVRSYTLVATNVPYLSVQKMGSGLSSFVERHYPDSDSDLATCFLMRSLELARVGSVAVVTLQGWLFLETYSGLRRRLLADVSWNALAVLGASAFSGISGHVVQVLLTVLSSDRRSTQSGTLIIDAIDEPGAEAKEAALRSGSGQVVSQQDLAGSPDALLAVGQTGSSHTRPLGEYASSWQGLVTGDVARFTIQFWEVSDPGSVWERFLTAPKSTGEHTGRDTYLRWEGGRGTLVSESKAHNFNPTDALRAEGVLVAESKLAATLYHGEMFNQGSVPIIPSNPGLLAPIWSFIRSDEWPRSVRRINQKVMVGSGYFLKVPFDLENWTKVAEELYPNGLPGPDSNDPTQWLFKGDPTHANEPLHVAVARLLGYRWPDQGSDNLDDLADTDGAVSITALAGERSAAERLRLLLERAWGETWSPGKLDELLRQAGAVGKDLDTWLRDSFFASHARLFHNRPFIWHIWDGRKDGFGVLVNYHCLDRQLLDRITHTLLGSWIEGQRDQVRRELPGAEARLSAAEELQRKLELIAQGEPPCDIYVRWKPLAEQPLGWDPDLNDGVRLNVRPFVQAGVLRAKFTVNWNKDRGMDPDGSERLNDLHFTRSEKERAKPKAGVRS